jgi:hypothetical protein
MCTMHFFMLAVGMHFDVIHVLKSATNSCKKVHFGCGKAIRQQHNKAHTVKLNFMNRERDRDGQIERFYPKFFG